MPLKLIGTIILLIVVTIFCGFNLENKCNISLVFYTFENVSVFLTVMVSFFAGILVMLPFAMFKKKMSKEQLVQAADKVKADEAKAAEKAEKARIKAEEKEKTLAEKGAREEKTIFDFKIRRQVKKDEKKDQASAEATDK